MTDDCQHVWSCPGALTLPAGEGSVAILLPLYCTQCAEIRTKVSPPPEVPAQNKIAKAQMIPPVPAQLQRR